MSQLSQEPPVLPPGKTVEACSTQEKVGYLAELTKYNEYLSQKIRSVHNGEGCVNAGTLHRTHNVHDSMTTGADDKRDDAHDTSQSSVFTLHSNATLISLAPPSPFDTQPFRYLFQQDAGKGKESRQKPRLWTEIGQGNTFEEEKNTGKLVTKRKNKKRKERKQNKKSDKCPSFENLSSCLALEGEKSDGDSTSGWFLEDGLSVACSQPKPAAKVPPKDPQKEKLRDDAYDVLSAAYYKIFSLEHMVYHCDDDALVKVITQEVSLMSNRLSQFIDDVEKASEAAGSESQNNGTN